jgi:hypothetical protein
MGIQLEFDILLNKVKLKFRMKHRLREMLGDYSRNKGADLKTQSTN